MRGAKPKLGNVVPLKGDGANENERALRARAVAAAKRLKPKGLTKLELAEWNRVGAILADPRVDRLKPHFVDAAMALVRVNLRIRAYDKFFAENKVDLSRDADVPRGAERVTGEAGLDAEIYMVEGRNGVQLKSHPHVAQRNECWRQWRSLIAMFGLNPADERNMQPGQAGLFDGEDAEFYN